MPTIHKTLANGLSPAFGVLIGAAVGTLFLVPAHGSAQDAPSLSCEEVPSSSTLEDVTRCAEQGDAAAQFNLGWMYDNGDGVPEDDEEAVRWVQLAAQQGHARAQFMLGIMYTRRTRCPKGSVLAHMWYALSASHCAMSFSCDLPNADVARSNKDFVETRRLSRALDQTYVPFRHLPSTARPSVTERRILHMLGRKTCLTGR